MQEREVAKNLARPHKITHTTLAIPTPLTPHPRSSHLLICILIKHVRIQQEIKYHSETENNITNHIQRR